VCVTHEVIHKGHAAKENTILCIYVYYISVTSSIFYILLVIDEGSNDSNRQSCTMRSWATDGGSPLNGGGGVRL
jgi:hypothetical protein